MAVLTTTGPLLFHLTAGLLSISIALCFRTRYTEIRKSKAQDIKKGDDEKALKQISETRSFFLNRTHEGPCLPSPKIKCPNPRFRNVKNFVNVSE